MTSNANMSKDSNNNDNTNNNNNNQSCPDVDYRYNMGRPRHGCADPWMEQEAAQWGLTVPITLLVPLLSIKLTETIFPTKSCVDVATYELSACEAKQRRVSDNQYFCLLTIGVVSLILSLVLSLYRQTSRSSLLGLAYGSMLTLLYAVFTNSARLHSRYQVIIIGCIVIGLLFLPRLSNGILIP